MNKTILLITLIICINSCFSFSQKCFGKGEIWMNCGCNKNCDNWDKECEDECSPGCYCQSEYTRLEGFIVGKDPCVPIECCPIKNCIKQCDQNIGRCERYLSQL